MIVVVRRRPGRIGEASVILLAVVQARREIRTEAGPPAAIRHNGVARAVLVVQFELGDRTDLAAVDLAAAAAEPEATPVPALGDGHPERVVALLHGIGDVERLVTQSMAIARPAGCEHMVADRRAIALGRVHAERRHVETGADQSRANRESGPETDRPLRRHVEIGRDRHGGPVRWFEQPDLEVERVAPVRRVSRRAGHAHPDLSSRPGR